MFDIVNNWITTRYETLINKESTDILAPFLEKNKGCHGTFLFPKLIDFREVKVGDNTVEIVRFPGVFSPFKSDGKIKFHLVPTDKRNWTMVKCEILPGNKSLPYIWSYQLLTTGALAVFFLVLGNDTTTIFGASLVLAVPGAMSYFHYRRVRIGLIDYSRAVIKLMRT